MMIAKGVRNTCRRGLQFEDIRGKIKCSEFVISEQFTPENLTVTRASNGGQSVYPIVRYDYQDTEVTVTWKDSKGADQRTLFGEFGGDGRSMMQLVTKDSPPIPHHRC